MATDADRSDRGVWRWALLFAGAGFLALAVQVYLLREYLVVLQADETSVGLGLASWLVGIALGAPLVRWLLVRRSRTVAALALGLLAIDGWAGVVLARAGRGLLGLPAGELVALGPAFWLASMVFIVPGILVGGGFVALVGAATHEGADAQQAIGRLYVLEAIGSLAAGLLASLATIPWLDPLTGLGLLVAVALAAATPAARARLIGGRWLIPALSVTTLLAASTPLASKLESATQRLRFGSLVPNQPLLDWVETPYEHIAIGGDEVRVEYAGGQYVASFPDPTEDESRAHRWMLLAEHPARVLALGGLETGALRFCLRHPVREIDLVVRDRRALEIVRRHLDPEDRAALEDPRVRLVFDDPRSFLGRGSDVYDLILRMQPDPATLLLARGVTVEMNRLVARRLAARGAYVTRLSVGPNVQAGETGTMGASVYRSLREVFEVVRAAPGPDGLLVSGTSREAVTLDPEALARRWRSRHIESEVFVPELLPWLFPPERVATLETELERASAGATLTTDNRPTAFIHALTMRQQLARSAWVPLLAWSKRHPLGLGLALLLPSLLLVGWQLGVRRGCRTQPVVLHATVVAGGCGMAYSLMLFFSFQTRVGVLYSQLGALSAVFMLGLALGGHWSARWPALLRAQAVGVATAVLVTLFFALLDRLDPGRGTVAVAHAALLALAGVATGCVFPAAANRFIECGSGGAGAASRAELCDHAGAAVAAVLVAILFVPVLGLVYTGALLVVLQLLALVACAYAIRFGRRRATLPGQSST